MMCGGDGAAVGLFVYSTNDAPVLVNAVLARRLRKRNERGPDRTTMGVASMKLTTSIVSDGVTVSGANEMVTEVTLPAVVTSIPPLLAPTKLTLRYASV